MMKKTLRIVAFLLAMLMMLAMFAGCNKDKKEEDDEDVDNTPEAAFRNSLASFATDLVAREELKPLVNMVQGGSLEIKFDMDFEKAAASVGEKSSGNVSAGGKFYFGEKSIFLKNLYADVNLPEDEIEFDVSGDLYVSPDYIYVANESILGGTVAIIRGEMEKAFKESVFISEKVFDDETVQIISQLLKVYDGEQINEAADEVSALIERYADILMDTLEKNVKFEDETKAVTVGGESVESRVITLTIDEKSVVGILNDLYATVKDDAALRALIVKYGDELKDYIGGTGEDLAKAYDQMLAELGSQLETLEEDISQGAIIVEVATATDASTLRKLTLLVRDGDESAETVTFMTLDAGKEGAAKSNCISLDIMEGETVITYKVTQNDENGYKAALEATMTGRSGVVLPEKPNNGGSINTKYDTEAFTPSTYAATSSYAETVTPEKDAEPEKRTMTCFAIDVNKKANTFALSIPEAGFTVGGSFKVEDDKTTIEINSLTADGETMDKGWALTIIIDESDEMPAIVDKNAATNFFDLTKGNLVDITDRLEKEFGEFFKADDSEANTQEGTKTDIPDYRDKVAH